MHSQAWRAAASGGGGEGLTKTSYFTCRLTLALPSKLIKIILFRVAEATRSCVFHCSVNMSRDDDKARILAAGEELKTRLDYGGLAFYWTAA